MYHRVDGRKSQHNLYLPEHFDPGLFLGRHHDEARWLVHTIFLRRVLDRREGDGYVPLHSTILRKMLGKDQYRPVIDALAAGGVVECDNTWVRAEKSKGYRLTALYRDQRHRKHVLHPESKMAKKIDGWRQARGLEVTLDVHRHLQAQFDRLEITGPITGLELDPETVQQVEMIRDQEWYLVPCPYGRVHHNLSSLDSRLRPYLRVDGRPLVNLDIRNSQPLMASIPLLMYYSSGCSLPAINQFRADSSYIDLSGGMFTGTINLVSESPEPHPQPSSPVPHTLSGRIPNSPPQLPADVREYIDLTQRGRLYDHLMAAWNIPDSRRREFKEDFFGQVMFCRDHRRYEYGRKFEAIYPNVVEVYEVLKAKDYTQAPKLLQRVESSLMINRVARRIMHEYPDAPVFTIHDSVLTLREYAEPFYRIIRQEFARIGLHPAIRIEDYQADQEAA